MISTGITVLLTLLCAMNVFLLFSLAYSGRGQKNMETKRGV